MEDAKIAFDQSFLSQFRRNDFLTAICRINGQAVTFMYDRATNRRYNQFTDTWTCTLIGHLYAWHDGAYPNDNDPCCYINVDDKYWYIRFATKEEISYMLESLKRTNWWKLHVRLSSLEIIVRDNKEE